MQTPRPSCSLSKNTPRLVTRRKACVEEAHAPSPGSGGQGGRREMPLLSPPRSGRNRPSIPRPVAMRSSRRARPAVPTQAPAWSLHFPSERVGTPPKAAAGADKKKRCPQIPSPVKGAEGSGEARRGSSLLRPPPRRAAAHVNSESPRHLTAAPPSSFTPARFPLQLQLKPGSKISIGAPLPGRGQTEKSLQITMTLGFIGASFFPKTTPAP